MGGKVVEPDVERSGNDRNVQVRSLLIVTAVGVVAIAAAIAVTTYRNKPARAAANAPSTVPPR